MQPRRARTGKSSSKSSRSDPSLSHPTAAVEVKLGVVGRPHGLRGELHFAGDPSTRDTLQPTVRLRLVTATHSQEFVVEQVRDAPRGLVLALDGVGDRSEAERWVGAEVFISRDSLSSSADSYFDFELVGLEVVSDEGVVLGRVSEVLATGANDVLVIASTSGGELLIPAIAGALLGVDVEAGKLIVDERTAVRHDETNVS